MVSSKLNGKDQGFRHRKGPKSPLGPVAQKRLAKLILFLPHITETLYICSVILKHLYKMAYVISDDCTACGTCIDECPVEAISEGDIYKIDPDTCTDCGSCADVCPVEAIHPA